MPVRMCILSLSFWTFICFMYCQKLSYNFLLSSWVYIYHSTFVLSVLPFIIIILPHCKKTFILFFFLFLISILFSFVYFEANYHWYSLSIVILKAAAQTISRSSTIKIKINSKNLASLVDSHIQSKKYKK